MHVDTMIRSSLRRRCLVVAGLLLVSGIVAGVFLPGLAPSSNCGGNSAALSACRGYITVLRIWQVDHGDQPFRMDQAGQDTRKALARIPGASWLHSARLLARLDDVRLDPSAHQRILLVCDQAYDNVPRSVFGRSPMTHAVASSTGETGLISVEAFSRLDFSGFVDLREWNGTTHDQALTPAHAAKAPPAPR